MRLSIRGIQILVVSLSLSVVSCSGDASQVSATFNQSAALAGDLPANPLQWKVITATVDPGTSTMSTLYGNDLAVACARTNSQHDYPAGSELALVTWIQTEDRRWFGAKIPDHVKSVEFVTVKAAPGGVSYAYEEYAGAPLKKSDSQESSTPNDRAGYILAQRAAVMP